MKTAVRTAGPESWALAAAIALSAGACARDLSEAPTVLAITNASIIDVTGGPTQSDMTLVIAGASITAVGKTESTTLHPNARVLDASGKFVIPGLWDMHVHTLQTWTVGDGTVDLYESFFPLFVAHGVTGVRDMNGSVGVLRRARERMETREIKGPRVVAAGLIVDGVEWSFGSIAVASQEDGRGAVRRLAREESDFIKVGGLLPREAYFGIAEAARELGLSLAGHVPFQVPTSEAVSAGQTSIEHLDGVLLGCSSNESALRQEAEALIEAEGAGSLWLARIRAEAAARQTPDTERCSTLLSQFAASRTWHVPTLVLKRATAFMDDPSVFEDPRSAYIPSYLMSTWGPDNGLTGHYTPEDFANDKRTFSRHLELVSAMHRAGVPFMSGTDAVDPYIFPGSSVHDEMELFVHAGLSPLEALQTATWNPARFLKMSESAGTVAVGKTADLVLLDANPLDDIRNTGRIWAVVLRGDLLDEEAIGAMMRAAREHAAYGSQQMSSDGP